MVAGEKEDEVTLLVSHKSLMLFAEQAMKNVHKDTTEREFLINPIVCVLFIMRDICVYVCMCLCHIDSHQSHEVHTTPLNTHVYII